MYVFEKQLKKLGIILPSSEVKMGSALGEAYKALFDKHGDRISMQYGGSDAHHSNLTKKKKFFENTLPELLTSVKRHYANNFLDPKRQLIINLFLGLYRPYDRNTKLSDWTIKGDWKLMQKLNENVILPEMNAKNKWWETALRKFEPTLPEPLKKDLDFLFSMG
jgi:hypothetical protein